MREELLKARAEIASPRMTDIIDARRRPGRREPDRAGPDGGDHHARRLHQAHHAGDVPRAEPRRARPQPGPSTRGDDIVTRSFNAHTHQWVLFFSSGGKAFREKVWRLPEAGPTAKGRALVNLLPELGSDTITTVLPLPQDETLWDSLHLRVRHRVGQRAAQPAVGFPQRPRRRPDRDEAGRGRPADRRRDLPRGRRRAARDPQGPLHPFPAVRRHGAGVRRPRQFAACAASGCRMATRSSACRCCAMSRPRTAERAAYLKQANAKRRGNGNGDDGGRGAG